MGAELAGLWYVYLNLIILSSKKIVTKNMSPKKSKHLRATVNNWSPQQKVGLCLLFNSHGLSMLRECFLFFVSLHLWGWSVSQTGSQLVMKIPGHDPRAAIFNWCATRILKHAVPDPFSQGPWPLFPSIVKKDDNSQYNNHLVWMNQNYTYFCQIGKNIYIYTFWCATEF